jgi:hypothetical protein
VDTETGELQEPRLEHREAAEKFYRDLAAQGMNVRVGTWCRVRILGPDAAAIEIAQAIRVLVHGDEALLKQLALSATHV